MVEVVKVVAVAATIEVKVRSAQTRAAAVSEAVLAIAAIAAARV
jgi:hypothetical protein